jgi:hypothetical protein
MPRGRGCSDRPVYVREVKTIYNDSYKKKHFSRISGDSQSIPGEF